MSFKQSLLTSDQTRLQRKIFSPPPCEELPIQSGLWEANKKEQEQVFHNLIYCEMAANLRKSIKSIVHNHDLRSIGQQAKYKIHYKFITFDVSRKIPTFPTIFYSIKWGLNLYISWLNWTQAICTTLLIKILVLAMTVRSLYIQKSLVKLTSQFLCWIFLSVCPSKDISHTMAPGDSLNCIHIFKYEFHLYNYDYTVCI